MASTIRSVLEVQYECSETANNARHDRYVDWLARNDGLVSLGNPNILGRLLV